MSPLLSGLWAAALMARTVSVWERGMPEGQRKVVETDPPECVVVHPADRVNGALTESTAGLLAAAGSTAVMVQTRRANMRGGGCDGANGLLDRQVGPPVCAGEHEDVGRSRQVARWSCAR